MDIQILQILFQIINFGVVLAALTFLMYKPMIKALQQRSKKIEDAEKAANEMLTEKEAMEKTKQKVLSDAKKQATTIMNEVEEKAELRKQELMKKAKEEVKEFVQEEKTKWEDEKSSMLKILEKDFAKAVFQISEKVLGQSVDQKAHSKLIDQSIAEVIKSL